MNFYSHKWYEGENQKFRYLRDHLITVGENAFQSVSCIYFSNKQFLAKAAFITGSLHDFGKYTSYFQDYLANNKSNSTLKSHAFISALYAAYCAQKNGLPDQFILYVYLAIKHHHGNLCNLDSDIGSEDNPSEINLHRNIETMKKQLHDIYKHKNEIKEDMIPLFEKAKEKELNLDYVEDFIQNYQKIFSYLVQLNIKFSYGKDFELKLDYSDFMLLYSALIDNDKRNAALLDNYDRKEISYNLINNYVKGLSKESYINEVRNDLYDAVSQNMINSDINNHFYTITAPTGTGKTLAGLSAALILRDRINSKRHKLYRIIYALPFTTIIDQNYNVMCRILEGLGNEFTENNHERYILKHHHLSLEHQKIENECLPLDKSLMLVEDWDSEIIFTTFVQVFQTFAGYKNKSLKKYHRMANSIIILDEIQSIQIEKWGDIRFLINEYAKKFDIYFILMTATQPKLIDKPVELSGQNFKDRFQKMNRVSMFFDLNPDTVKNVLDKYINSYQEVAGISMLFVLNTIKTSIEAYEYLKKKQIKNLFYISSNIVPIKRIEVINKIMNAIKNKEKIIVVGTQIFEAGIDISFDLVIRDLAPIDSIIQSSGRVNRHGENKKGKIYVVNISPENKTCDGYYSKKVYGKLHTDTSLKILNMYNGKIISEVDYLELIEKYYNEITKEFPASSENLKQSFEKLSYINDNNGHNVSDFTLIDDKGYVSIFVEIDESAHNTIEEYKKYKKNDNSYNDENIIRLKKEINNYIVQTRENNIKNINCEPLGKGNNFLIIRKDYLQSSYDDETGIKLTIEDEEGGDSKWNII